MQLSLVVFAVIFITETKSSLVIPLRRLETAQINSFIATGLRNVDSKFFTANLSGLPGMGYYVPTTIGTPQQELNILLDTGSADLAVAARDLANIDRWFDPSASSTLECTGFSKRVRYQQGSWHGPLCKDRLTFLTRNASALDQPFTPLPPVPVYLSLINRAKNFFLPHSGSTWEGIIGLGYPKLMMENYPTRNSHTEMVLSQSQWIRVLWKLFQRTPEQVQSFESLISAWNLPNMFSLLLCGLTQQPLSPISNTSEEMNGLFLIGGTKLAGIAQPVGSILYTPVREPWFYEIVLADLLVEGLSVMEDCKELNAEYVIVDSGTTNIQVPERVFKVLLKHIQTYVLKQSSAAAKLLKNHTAFWAGVSMLCETASRNQVGGSTGLPYVLFPVIEFQMLTLERDSNRVALSLSLSPQQYIRFVGRSTKSGVMRDCFAFGIRPSHSGTILGAVFMEGFFNVFRRDSLQVGFGNSTCNRYSNVSTVPTSSVNGFRPWSSSIGRKTPLECAFHRPVTPEWMESVRTVNVGVSIATFLVITLHLVTVCVSIIFQRIKCCS